MRRGFSSAFGSVCKPKRIRSEFGDPAGEGLPPHPYHQQKSAQYIDYKGPSGDASRKRVRKLLILMAIEVKYNKQRGLQFFELELLFTQWDTTRNQIKVKGQLAGGSSKSSPPCRLPDV
jgi:hypothetical protein